VPAECTENLDRLSREYLSFHNFYTSSLPTSWGLDALFLSRLDYEQDLEMRNISVFDILKKHGFCGYYISPVPGMFADNRAAYEKLFHPEHILFLEELHQKFRVKGSQGWGLSDEKLYQCALNILGGMPRDEKFFMALSTVDSHPPYALSGPLKKDKLFPSPFLNCLRCTDRNLNDFLNEIMRLPIFDERMLIVVTADHSATHGENFHKRNDYLPDRIPLILISKNNHLENRFAFDKNKLCAQTDLPVTLLNLLGIRAPETFMGDNMLTKKSFALTRSSVWLTLHLEDKDIIVNFEDAMNSASKEERAVMEYYNCFYGSVFGER